MKPWCIIVGSTVTALCAPMMGHNQCTINTNMMIGAIPNTAMSISGTLTTTNIIMANWSKDMWQSVVNRTIRMLASGPLRSHFFSAVGTVS
ncbi:hypothetical protein KIN20_018197 [Parelaphostrongylus tenuis]|uniref:Secreted protein n=1 Tax=Parelaphostrongylus tenuis TaxID=148309 RepID=A0AAD5MMJ9_PARTN|nr:hypothetical protein KIN20_018197 [Parelaphostrongylus tenuis]